MGKKPSKKLKLAPTSERKSSTISTASIRGADDVLEAVNRCILAMYGKDSMKTVGDDGSIEHFCTC